MKNESLVAVYTGPRGSGKTLSMAYWLLVAMVQGKKVYSNIDIACKLRWKTGQLSTYKSLPQNR